jgi:hypothetical protein
MLKAILTAGGTAKDMFYDQAHHLLWVGTSDPNCSLSTRHRHR